MPIILNADNPLIIAQEFCESLEADSEVRVKFICNNIDNFKWLTSKHPVTGEPTRFWHYGPEIPNTNGLLLNVCSVYYYGKRWRYNFTVRNCKVNIKKTNYKNFEEIKEMIENKVREIYANTT